MIIDGSTSFLNSRAWERVKHLEGVPSQRIADEVFSQYSFGFGNYWQGSRLELSDPEGLIPLSNNCFARVEPLHSAAELTLRSFANRHGFTLQPTHAIQPRQTVQLDLSQSLEQLRSQLKPKHRYNLGLAERQNLTFDSYSSLEDCQKALPRFLQLHTDTAARQNFRIHSAAHYQHIISALAPESMVQLLFIRQAERDLATAMIIHHKDTASYLHGGSIANPGPIKAPFLLHWQAISSAQAAGCTVYDLWGTDAEWNAAESAWQPKDGKDSAGTTRFKLGFAGSVISYPGCFDLIFQPFCYSVYKAIRQIRSRKRTFS